MKRKSYSISLVIAISLVFIIPGLAAQSDDQDGSGFNISIGKSCETSVPGWQAPGDTRTDPSVIAYEETGYITGLIRNGGNYVAKNVTARIWVTKEDDIWSPNEKIGTKLNLDDQNGTYLHNYTIPGIYQDDQTNSSTRLIHEPYYTYPSNGEGNFTARLNLTYSCNGVSKKVTAFDNFIVLPAAGESGGVNVANNTGSPTPEDINDTGGLSNATISQNNGTQESDVTRPQQSDQRNESAEPQQGNAKSPGKTPEPEPEPEPEPKPVPRLELDIQPINNTYHANQSQFAPIQLKIENVGNQKLTQLSIEPLISDIRPGWQVRSAEISTLAVNETIRRDVFVRPPEDAEPGLYVSPVVGRNSKDRLDIDYFSIMVHETEFESSLRILETPRSVSMTVNSTQNLPVLLQNTGETRLNNISARFQNLDECGSANITSIRSIDVNESRSLNINIKASESSQTCNSTLIVSSSEGAYSFTNIKFTTTPEQGLIPKKQRVPFLAILWTLILAAYSVVKKRYQLDSNIVKLPFIMLLMGETLIVLYLVVNYYGIMSVSFLPF